MIIRQEGGLQGSALLCVKLEIMDINSVEFYTLAFVVAMALVALLMGRTEKYLHCATGYVNRRRCG